MTNKTKITLITLIISFTITFPVSTIATLKIMKSTPQKSNVKQLNKYTIPKTQDITILITICENFSKTAEIYIIIKFSAHDNEITIGELPKKLKLKHEKSNQEIEKIYEFGGINLIKQTLENHLNIEINNTIKLDHNAIDGITNELGGFKLQQNNEQKIIHGKTLYNYFYQSPIKALLQLKNNFNKQTNLNKFFITLTNLSQTDISVYDFEIRKNGFKNLIRNKNIKTTLLANELDIMKYKQIFNKQ